VVDRRFVGETINQDLPREIDYLRRHDEAMRRIMETAEMPDRLAENLLSFIRKNNGTLGKKRQENEFAAQKNEEVTTLEAVVSDVFEDFGEASDAS
jgi:ribosomal protein S7